MEKSNLLNFPPACLRRIIIGESSIWISWQLSFHPILRSNADLRVRCTNSPEKQFWRTWLGIYTRKKESKKTRKHALVHANTHASTQKKNSIKKTSTRTRKNALVQESVHAKKNSGKKTRTHTRTRTRFSCFRACFLACFLFFFYKFPALKRRGRRGCKWM